MTTKNLMTLVGVAVVLGGAAVFLGRDAKGSAPKLNGKAVFPDLAVSEIASVEFGDKLKIASGKDGWTVATYHNYPASREKITQNLLKLSELKVGQVARGKKLDKPTNLVLKGADGKELAKLPLGPKHAKWEHGRYAAFEGESVLLSDSLDGFDGNGKDWIETKIVDEPWISFNDLADEKLTEAELGFKTGVVAKVTIAGDTNRVIRIGGVVKGGSDRYLKIDGSKWVYQVSSYSVDKFLPKPPKEEAKKAEPKKAEPAKKVESAKKPEVKKPEVKAQPDKKAVPAKKAEPKK